MSQNNYEEETVTKYTLVATTVTKVMDANAERKLAEIWDETGGTLYFAFTNTAPSNTDTMKPLPANTAYIAERNSGIAKSALYAYSTAGGVIKVSEA